METNSPKKHVLSKLSPFEVLAKARLDSGVHVAVSPNMVFIPEVSVTGGESVQARADGMFRWGEFTKWPSFSVKGWAHLACIPMRPQWRELRKYLPWSTEIMKKYNPVVETVLWRDLEEEDYTSKDALDLKMGTIAPEIIKSLKHAQFHILSLAQLTRATCFPNHADDSWKEHHVAMIANLSARVNASVLKLANFRQRRMDLLVTFRDAQRFLLETMGWVIYHAEI
ncbi:hypothetical protein BD410DRAFT_810232, partial [Rickenella mellea]